MRQTQEDGHAGKAGMASRGIASDASEKREPRVTGR